jgi:hypothetical protein
MERDTKNWKNSVCEYYLRGSCYHKQSKDCSFAHGDQDLQWYKTSLCQHHETGNCEYGTKCRHAHGKFDLRRDCKFHFEFKHGCKQGSACAFSHQEKDSQQDAGMRHDRIERPSYDARIVQKSPGIEGDWRKNDDRSGVRSFGQSTPHAGDRGGDRGEVRHQKSERRDTREYNASPGASDCGDDQVLMQVK